MTLALAWSTTYLAFLACAAIAAAMNRGGFSARNTLAARAFTGPDRTKIRAGMRVAVNLGIGGGSLCAAVVLATNEPSIFRAAMTAACAAPLVGAWLTSRIRHTGVATAIGPGTARSARSPFRDRRFLALSAVNVVTATQFAITEVGMPIWVVEHTEAPTWIVSALLVTNTIVIVLLQVRVTRGFERLPRAGKAYAVAAVAIVLATLGYAAAGDLECTPAMAILVAAVVVHSVAEILMVGAAMSAAFELAIDGNHGAYQGTYSAAQSGGFLLGPVLIALAITAGWVGWLALAGIYAATCTCGWLLLGRA